LHYSPVIQDHLEISCIHCALNPQFLKGEGPLLEFADYILHDDFFNRIEIAHITDPAIRRKLVQRAEICRVNRTFLAQPTVFTQQLNMGSLDRAERERAIQQLRICLDEAQEIGADMMTFCSGPADGTDLSVGMDYYADGIAELHRRAEELRIHLILEPFDEQLDKKRFFGSTKKVVALMERLPTSMPYFSIMVDLSHIPLLSEDITETVQQLSPYLEHVHIGNGVTLRGDSRFGDSHPYFGYPNGNNDIEEITTFLSALIQVGYIKTEHRNTLGIELIPVANESVKDVLAGAKRTLRDAWSRTLSAMKGSE
jgi:sugar phosphate isomerase/epimerase